MPVGVVGIPFEKYEGLGNDFVIIDAEVAQVDAPLAKRICDRHFGVGADGVLWVTPSELGDAGMAVVNADGSMPEMCGNGLRCVALYLARRAGKTSGYTAQVETGFGLLECQLTSRHGAPWVTISLGRGQPLGSFEYEGREFHRVSMGNPHAVVFGASADPAAVDALAPRVSAQIEHGANVGFAQVEAADRMRLTVFERGVGRTLACGTGAGAATVAAARAGLVDFDAPVAVRLPGGELEITVWRDLAVSLTGPARFVFRGMLEPSAFVEN